MNEKRSGLVVGFLGGVVGALITTALLFGPNLPHGSVSSQGGSANTPSTGGYDESRVVSVAKSASPAVVSIIISKDVPVRTRRGSAFSDPFFDQFFGSDGTTPDNTTGTTQRQEIGGGSGFFVSSDGYILTNAHVVDDKKADYTVYTNDGKSHPATVTAIDTVLDLAVIKIDGSGYAALSFADSEKVQVGETAIAIGNALAEFRNTVSVGVISGLSRSIVAGDEMGSTPEALDGVLQTDAAINPGNSGGPLLNSSGDVIGVNVAVAANYQGIGFAIPANAAKSVVESVKKNGRIVRAFLGIRYLPLSADVASELKLSVTEGALIQKGTQNDPAIVAGSPAAKAGLRDGDVITAIDGTELTETTSLSTIVRKKNPGDTITLSVVRDGKTITLKATLTEAPTE